MSHEEAAHTEAEGLKEPDGSGARLFDRWRMDREIPKPLYQRSSPLLLVKDGKTLFLENPQILGEPQPKNMAWENVICLKSILHDVEVKFVPLNQEETECLVYIIIEWSGQWGAVECTETAMDTIVTYHGDGDECNELCHEDVENLIVQGALKFERLQPRGKRKKPDTAEGDCV